MSTETLQAIAHNVRRLRKARFWTQQQLADAAGMKRERISEIETLAVAGLSTNTLDPIAGALGVSVSVLTRQPKPMR